MTEPTRLDALVAEVAPTLRGLLGEGRRLPRIAFTADETAAAGPHDVTLDAASLDDPAGAALRLADLLAASGSADRIVVPGAGAFVADRSIPAGRVGGRVALVTGAAQGFGLAIAEGLVAQGAFVVLADLNTALAEANARRLSEEAGEGRAMATAMDVTDEASVAAGVNAILRRFGGLDIVVSNAGVLRAASVTTQPLADFDLVTRVNYRGYFLVTKHSAPVLARQHRANPAWWGDIIEINSKSGLQGSSRNSAYAGSKFGGIGLTQSFALELVGDGIKVNAVCPGNFLDGPLWSDPQNGLFVQYLRERKVPGATTVEDVRHAYEAKVPMGRGCDPADVLEAILYLIAQQYETGQALPVTGGQVMLS